jgi:hypothetical protein
MSSGGSVSATIPRWATAWHRHGATVVRAVAVALVALSVVWLGYEAWRFFWQPAKLGSMYVHPGALDLKMRWVEIHDWFAGKPVFSAYPLAVYPPASYAILWPFVGWLSEREAIRLWAATTALALGWLTFLAVKHSGAARPRERWLAAALPLSMYATGATVGNGQSTIHVLAALVPGMGPLAGGGGGWGRDVLVCALILFALVKPNVTAPFFWIVLFRPGCRRPAVLVMAAYTALTVFAAAFQAGGLPGLFDEWVTRTADTAGNPYLVVIGFGLPTALAALGLGGWGTPATLLVLIGLGVWLFRHRRGDLWLRLGVTAIVARLWTFHLWYDDLLFLLPMVALFRLTRATDRSRNRPLVSGVLLAVLVAINLAPGGLYLLAAPWRHVYIGLQVVVWLAVLAFLVHEARESRRHRIGPEEGTGADEHRTATAPGPDPHHAG